MSRYITDVKVLTDKQVRARKWKVLERDKGRCVICGKYGDAHTHEVLFKSSGVPNSALVYRMRYMACLCPWHHKLLHDTDQRRMLTVQILITLRSRHGYKYPRRLSRLLDVVAESLRADVIQKLQ